MIKERKKVVYEYVCISTDSVCGFSVATKIWVFNKCSSLCVMCNDEYMGIELHTHAPI